MTLGISNEATAKCENKIWLLHFIVVISGGLSRSQFAVLKIVKFLCGMVLSPSHAHRLIGASSEKASTSSDD